MQPEDGSTPPRPDSARPPIPPGSGRRGDSGTAAVVAGRRRASRALWQACEALLAAGDDPVALDGALEGLRRAFDCDGVALHVTDAGGMLQPWCACGGWQGEPGDLRDCVTVPLLRGAERIGSLDLRARPGRRFMASQLGLVRAASGALGAALGARRELERLRLAPGRDPATGLPDQAAFTVRLEEEMARVREYGTSAGVLVVELDGFDLLEARHGAEAARAVLAEAALSLRLTLRDSDVLARLDGPRFAVMLPEADTAPALRCAERLERALVEHAFPRVSRVAASVGVATAPRDGIAAVELMQRATEALGVARKATRRRVAAHAVVRTH